MNIRRRNVTPQDALVRLEQQCCRAEMSEGEARAKLRRWQIASADADKIVDSLLRGRFIDDRRFARAFVNDKVKFARWGRRKIQGALMQKRVSPDIIAEALDEIDDDTYTGGLRHIITAKISAKPELTETYEQRTNLYRWILSRGYEPRLAASELRSILTEMRDK